MKFYSRGAIVATFAALLAASCDAPKNDLNAVAPRAAVVEAKSFVLTVVINGPGSVSKRPDQLEYPAGTVVTLTAVPSQDADFDYWWGEYADGADPEQRAIQVVMNQDSKVTAEFIERPGVGDLNLIDDLAKFLVAVGETATIDTFDRNEIEYDSQAQGVYVPNGIPDAAELYLLENVLMATNLDLGYQSGIVHEPVWAAWTANVSQAEKDLPGADPSVQRAVAAYMTLGDYTSAGIVGSLVEAAFHITLDPFDYDLSRKKFLNYDKDADNDGILNYEEWKNASPDGSLAGKDRYAATALDGKR